MAEGQARGAHRSRLGANEPSRASCGRWPAATLCLAANSDRLNLNSSERELSHRRSTADKSSYFYSHYCWRWAGFRPERLETIIMMRSTGLLGAPWLFSALSLNLI